MAFPSTRQPAELNIHSDQNKVWLAGATSIGVGFALSKQNGDHQTLENRMFFREILWIMIIKLTPIWRINCFLNNLEQ